MFPLQKEVELRDLEDKIDCDSKLGGLKPRNGSDGDSGVLVTGDENEVFSTESTTNGECHRSVVNTPSTGDSDQTAGDTLPAEA